MKTRKNTFAFLLLIATINLSAQSLKILNDGSVHLFKTGLNIIWLGSAPSYGYDNGEWAIDTNGGTGDEQGSLNFSKPWPSPYAGNYKLYFARNGDVGIGKKPESGAKLDVAGSIAIYGEIKLSSDKRLKRDILPISNQSINLYKLNGKTYKKDLPFDSTSVNYRNCADKTISADKIETKTKVLSQNTEFGFLAQELKEVFPDLVSQDSKGYYLIDYIGLIPVIVESLKEQKAQIDTQAKQIADLTDLVNKSNSALKKVGASQASSTSETDVLSYPVLDQNIPNPFNTATTIGFYLPATVNSAVIYVYDMNGIQFKSYPITQRAKGNITIQGSELNAGMYLYALIADGKVIDTKRMILTK